MYAHRFLPDVSRRVCRKASLMSSLLKVKNLRTTFSSDWGKREALDGVSFAVSEQEILCIVGESGGGKSVTALSLMGLLPRNGCVVDGEALFEGTDLLKMRPKELDKIRGGPMSMIFQDAISSLNPVFTVGNQLIEAVRSHRRISRRAAKEEAKMLLKRVGLPGDDNMLERYPHALSGGMRQRVMIAMALAGKPKLLIADEPTTALDVTIQAQIMYLLRELCEKEGLSVILITHDIGLVAQMADRVLVMYAGQVVEQSYVHELFDEPRHPYTRGLMQAVPSIYDDKENRLASIPGTVPESYQDITGCRFASRCKYTQESCYEPQPLRCNCTEDGQVFPHCVRCHRALAGTLPPYEAKEVGKGDEGVQELIAERTAEAARSVEAAKTLEMAKAKEEIGRASCRERV